MAVTFIKNFRIAHNCTQQQIAELVGITRGAFANIENGKREPDIATLICLADYFKISIDQLIRGNEASFVKANPLSESERSLLFAYRQASSDDQAIIDNIVSRYTHGPASSSLA